MTVERNGWPSIVPRTARLRRAPSSFATSSGSVSVVHAPGPPALSSVPSNVCIKPPARSPATRRPPWAWAGRAPRVWRGAGRAAGEVARRAGDVPTLGREQLDEPGLVLDLLVQDARRHVVRARVLPEREVADLRPAPDRAPLRLEEHLEDRLRRRSDDDVVARASVAPAVPRSGQVGVGTARPLGEGADVVRKRPAELI